MATLVWLRNDLRLADNPALFRASEEHEGVAVVYFICKEFVERHFTAPVRLDFARRHLLLLAQQLAKLNISLQVESVERAADIPQRLLKLTQQLNCDRLHFNAEYPLDELNRDRKVAAVLRDHGVAVKRFHDRVIVPPTAIRNGAGEPYKVFTAFKKKWLQTVMPLSLEPLPVPEAQPAAVADSTTPTAINHAFAGFSQRDLADLWPAGEDEAYRRLTQFIDHDIKDYKEQRDFPAIEGTSALSPYLAIGAISPRQCLNAVLTANRGEWDTGSEGITCWIGELIWREFYQHVVVDFPRVCKDQAMQPHTEAFPWRYDASIFLRWCEGQTGIPIIDAAMLQLKETGWMHNRLRMVVAMFLTKNLQIDWRMGEQYFMSQLIDGDFAANNGGWQWCASTGTDAAPYFRIFNPVSQAQRFDPNGEFIRTYLPQLAECSDKTIHSPKGVKDYPEAIVDLAESRRRSIELFANLTR